LFRQTVLESIQLDGKPRESAVKIQEVFPGGMLAPEFEPGKSPSAESTPEFLFFLGLLPPQSASIVFGIHWAKTITKVDRIINMLPLSLTLSPRFAAGRGNQRCSARAPIMPVRADYGAATAR
jgi:hypothetical protein